MRTDMNFKELDETVDDYIHDDYMIYWFPFKDIYNILLFLTALQISSPFWSAIQLQKELLHLWNKAKLLEFQLILFMGWLLWHNPTSL